MSVQLNHTIVRSHDKAASAAFLADILGIPVAPQWGPFVPVPLDRDLALEFLQVGPDDEIQSQHYAFLVSDAEFDAAFGRIKATGLTYYADPFHRSAGEINHDYGGRGVYFDDPNGHNLELMTVPYGETPGS